MQYNDDGPGLIGNGTSLSVTVFKDLVGNLTLSIRGTADDGDMIPTNLAIAVNGAGYDQIVALHNWWLRASASSGMTVPQYRVLSTNLGQRDAVSLPGGRYLVRSDDEPSTGVLSAHLADDADGQG